MSYAYELARKAQELRNWLWDSLIETMRQAEAERRAINPRTGAKVELP